MKISLSEICFWSPFQSALRMEKVGKKVVVAVAQKNATNLSQKKHLQNPFLHRPSLQRTTSSPMNVTAALTSLQSQLLVNQMQSQSAGIPGESRGTPGNPGELF